MTATDCFSCGGPVTVCDCGGEGTDTSFDFEPAYKVDGYGGIAWRAYAWEEVADEDTEWSGYKVRTGRILAHMIGDDREHSFEPDELTAISDDDYCSGCGQIGCGHGGGA